MFGEWYERDVLPECVPTVTELLFEVTPLCLPLIEIINGYAAPMFTEAIKQINASLRFVTVVSVRGVRGVRAGLGARRHEEAIDGYRVSVRHCPSISVQSEIGLDDEGHVTAFLTIRQPSTLRLSSTMHAYWWPQSIQRIELTVHRHASKTREDITNVVCSDSSSSSSGALALRAICRKSAIMDTTVHAFTL